MAAPLLTLLEPPNAPTGAPGELPFRVTENGRQHLGRRWQHLYTYVWRSEFPVSQGLYAVRRVGIEKLILHLRYEAGPTGNHALHKLGASIALAWR